MPNSTIAALALTAVLGGGALLMGTSAPASAMVASGLSSKGIVESIQIASPVEQVKKHRKSVRKYDRRRHGARYRHKHGKYRYNYGGYWYATPWWLAVPGLTIMTTPPVVGGQCEHWRIQCTRNWGYGNSNYYGCMRYHGCY